MCRFARVLRLDCGNFNAIHCESFEASVCFRTNFGAQGSTSWITGIPVGSIESCIAASAAITRTLGERLSSSWRSTGTAPPLRTAAAPLEVRRRPAHALIRLHAGGRVPRPLTLLVASRSNSRHRHKSGLSLDLANPSAHGAKGLKCHTAFRRQGYVRKAGDISDGEMVARQPSGSL